MLCCHIFGICYLKVDPDILVRQSPECKDYLLEAYRYHLKEERSEENERSRPRQPIPLSKVLLIHYK